jgi:putative membrane protein
MAAAGLRSNVHDRIFETTAVLSVVGLLLVAGTFAGWFDGVYPSLAAGEVTFLAHLIAAINTTALLLLLAGVYFIRNRQIQRHRAAMVLAFTLILFFLVVYLLKVGGGFERELVAGDAVRGVYLVMLAVHILLSILSMPLVLYVVLLGLTHSPAELTETRKARVGRIAASAWILSLSLGVVTYLMLNHVFDSQPRNTAALLALAVPAPLRGPLHGALVAPAVSVRRLWSRVRGRLPA